ncbi:MAG TPA: bifunctional phosphoribosylaminoimidazolecarboxamide formyltransferase/IMP cyclohydrolase [Terriglobales bacterium]|nr:bifunctional phosphoribosylaminoimidazolecarboxamide formyltransferase/IMP cyclohydrolase [Terriglobales bacterium]
MSWPGAALFSLSDRTGAAEFARALAARGTRILASGGTAKQLAAAGVEVGSLERLTGFAELLGGRVKTLHPHVHAPILARRSQPGDLAQLATLGLAPIDLVAVSLYPFESRAASLDEASAVEEIDVGGVALLRAAAKNYADVIVLHAPEQYAEALAALETGAVTLERRRAWAVAAFERTARYDAAIAADLARRAAGEEPGGPPRLHLLAFERARSLRYGENPHQPAALYAGLGERAALDAWREGRELSFNNLVDLEAAVSLAGRFEAPACVIVKHAQPCGAAIAANPAEAWAAAFHTDEQSAFGGIVAFNRPLDAAAAAAVAKRFIECVAAPDFAEGALEAFQKKKNIRVVRLAAQEVQATDPWMVKPVGRWALLSREPEGPAPEWRVVTERAPTVREMQDLRFAWEIAAAARSNAVAIARGSVLVGVGSGQTSRVDAVDVALMKARRAGHDLRDTVLASDGFFPFADNVEHAAEAGVTAFVQPGGSVRDEEVIAACDHRGHAMVFTDRRVFRH